MATLNIKRFPDDLYEVLRQRAAEEHRSIAQQVTHLLSRILTNEPKRSILDLKGLGKEVWQGIDAADHIERERRSWD